MLSALRAVAFDTDAKIPTSSGPYRRRSCVSIQQRAEDAIDGDRLFHVRAGYDAVPRYLLERFLVRGWRRGFDKFRRPQRGKYPTPFKRKRIWFGTTYLHSSALQA